MSQLSTKQIVETIGIICIFLYLLLLDIMLLYKIISRIDKVLFIISSIISWIFIYIIYLDNMIHS